MNLSFLVSFKEWIPQRVRISIALLLWTGIWLVLFVSSAVVHAEKSTENSGVRRADFNAPIKDTKNNVDSGIQKETFIDKGDFYFLNTGEKKAFLRSENSYFIIYKRKAVPSMTPGALQKRFKENLDITKGRRLKNLTKFKIKKSQKHKDIIASLYQADPAISFISPVLANKNKGGELAIVPSLIVSIDNKVDKDTARAELRKYSVSFMSGLTFTDTEFELKIDEPVEDVGRIFETARTIAKLPFIRWAEPNFAAALKTHFIPNDPLFDNQWHLHNTGQNGAAVDGDVDAPEGWDISQGNGAVIAVYDGGIDLAHEDLNIWLNPGESGGGKETNGIDDDSNGYIDDYQGWDFTDDDNDPSPVDEPGPFGFKENHATSVAGVAGATGNNNIGVSGSAQGAEIIPVRMNSGLCSDFADAMRYAGKYADVVNNSWSIDACYSSLNAAISDVVNGNIIGARRGSLGTPVLFAAGNDASGWIKFILGGIPAGTYTFEWRFSKDGSVSAGYDTVWLDNITWPGGIITDFEGETVGSVPADFSSGGSAVWTVVSDGIHARGASGMSAKAGTISDLQETYLYITRQVSAGELTFWAWVSSEQDYDFFDFYVDGINYFHFSPGQYGHFNEVGYPASHPDTIAVGASNDGIDSGEEERSYYSQFGSALDVVAPSSGGVLGITTTDRMGASGYTSSNYTLDFGGTSSATPLVAGIVADIIVHNPSLTASDIRTVLHEGADKIGPYTYPGGRNDFYGYGRVNLFNALTGCPDHDDDGYSVCQNDCDDENAAVYPDAPEACDNLDNDCDGFTDENLTRPTTCGLGVCSGNTGTETCTAGVWADDTCDPFAGATAEICDDLDNNCDGQTDEGLNYQLYALVNPPGNGALTPDCSGGCSYDCLDSVVLNAVESEGYPFYNWILCDIPSGSICTMIMDDDKNLIAEFSSCMYPARISGSSSVYYDYLQDAVNAAAAGDVLQSQNYLFAESVTFSNAVTIIFEAGYDCTYETSTGTTTISGNLTINNGSVTIQKGTLEIQ
jgi:subtilisin family serine protease